jgi:hypothetical protein
MSWDGVDRTPKSMGGLSPQAWSNTPPTLQSGSVAVEEVYALSQWTCILRLETTDSHITRHEKENNTTWLRVELRNEETVSW